MKRVLGSQVIIHGGRFFILSVVSFLFSVACHAQDSTSTTLPSNKNFVVKEDPSVSNLITRYKEYNRKREFGEGFRIQITSTNVRDEVYKSKGAMYKEFPDLASYVEYEQPDYKLRIGDFKSRLQATYYLQQVVMLYPGAFIVHDKIKIK